MHLVRVVVHGGVLVRLAKADEVGGDDPVAGGCEHGDHLAVEVGPRGLTMQAQDDLLGVGVALVQVVHPGEGDAGAEGELDVVGLEGVTLEKDKEISIEFCFC